MCWKIFLILSCVGCHHIETGDEAIDKSMDLGEVVLRVSDNPIYVKQIQAESKRQTISNDLAAKHAVENSILSALARKSGIAGEGSLVVDQVLAQRWIDLQAEPLLQKIQIPDELLYSTYGQRLDLYQRPRQAEIEVLAIYTGTRMKPEPKLLRRTIARELEESLKSPMNNQNFAAIATMPKWSTRHVVYTRIFQGPDSPLPQTVGTVVLKFNKPGQTSPLISDEDGYFIAKYISERPPINIPYDHVKHKIADSIFEKWRLSRFAELTTHILKNHVVEILSSK